MREPVSLVRAWTGVHPARTAATLLAAAGLLSFVGARARIDSLGFLLFETPVSLLLLVPVIAGIGVGIGCDNTVKVPLPEPARLFPARLAWLLTLTVAGSAAVSAGQLVGPVIDGQAAVRNLLVHTTLALLTVSLVGPSLAWLPPVALTLVSMLFGYPPSEPGYYWWAAVMDETVSTGQWVASGAAFCGAALIYTIRPSLSPHVGRRSAVHGRTP